MESTTVELTHEGATRLFRLRVDDSNPNRPIVVTEMLDEFENVLGGHQRVWLQDGRATSDAPGVDGAYYHTQGENNHIEVQ